MADIEDPSALAAIVVLFFVLIFVGVGLLLIGDWVQGVIALLAAAASFLIAWKGFGQ
jgi:hypothetical protein